MPDGVDDASVRRRLLVEYNLEIGAGLGALSGKVWRIGLMGHACNLTNVLGCVAALETILVSEGASVPTGVAVEAARRSFESSAI